jgi:hypothetical protein
MDDIYAFIFRGVLTDIKLDSEGRQRNKNLNAIEIQELRQSLNFDLLDKDTLVDAQRMALVYAAIYTLENMARVFVSKTMADAHGETWWEKVPEPIKRKVKTRIEEDQKLRWHSSRGKTEIIYSDFGDLQSIITANWDLFKDVLISQEWTRQILSTLEKSRNIAMHGGVIDRIDIERIGINIRDWIRQVG